MINFPSPPTPKKNPVPGRIFKVQKIREISEVKGKKHFTYGRTKAKNYTQLLRNHASKKSMKYLKCERNHQPRILYLVKLFFKSK